MIDAATLGYEFAGNTIRDYLIASGILVAAILVLKMFKCVVLSRLRKVAKGTKNDVDDLVVQVLGTVDGPFYFSVGLYLAVNALNLPAFVGQWVYYGLVVLVTYYGAKVAQKLVDYGTQKLAEQKDEEQEVALLRTMNKILKGTVWVLAMIMALQNLGYNVSTLLAGVGVGGIAIAFALQTILEDVFASFSIYFDKPFKVGDYIVVDGDGGTVQHIGIKSTTIRTLKGQELIVSNKELTSARINNYKRMETRRVAFDVTVAANTPVDKLEKVPGIIEGIIKGLNKTKFNRAFLKEAGDFGFIYDVVYIVESPSYSDYMQAQQNFLLELVRRFAEEGIEMPYPTQTIVLEK